VVFNGCFLEASHCLYSARAGDQEPSLGSEPENEVTISRARTRIRDSNAYSGSTSQVVTTGAKQRYDMGAKGNDFMSRRNRVAKHGAAKLIDLHGLNNATASITIWTGE
jgi:hypothetical protein